MRLITLDDFIELYFKMKQRGFSLILSKLNPSAIERTKSTFNDKCVASSNWWIIPKVRERWNEIITGEKNVGYEEYVVEKYLSDKNGLSMLSLGCGTGSHEIKFAQFKNFKKIIGVDISSTLIKAAKKRAHVNKLNNLTFEEDNVNQMDIEKESYDIILFHSSLHHFYSLESLIKLKIIPALKKDGLLILNDYWGPNRLQFSRQSITLINQLLKNIPDAYKVRFKSNTIKKKIYGPGWLRMKISDPSEAAESQNIKPLLRKYFKVEEEKKLGGNILMLLLKDIAHHFLNRDEITEKILEELFLAENEHLKKEESLLFFGVYRLNSTSMDLKNF